MRERTWERDDITTCLSIIKDDNSSAVGLARPFPVVAKHGQLKENTPSEALLTCNVGSRTMDSFKD